TGAQNAAHRGGVVERLDHTLGSLPRLVSLAADHDYIVGSRGLDGLPNGLAAVEDDARVRSATPATSRLERLGDRARIFVARIVVGDDRVVGELPRGFSHGFAFEVIAVAPGAEHGDDSAVPCRLGELTRRSQRSG